MTECREFFEALDGECRTQGAAIRGPRLRAMRGDREQRLIEWESQTASGFSPGPVSNHETIRKALYQGKEIVDGLLHRNSFLPLDTVGFSADRTSFTTDDECKARSAARASSETPLYGYIDVTVASLRERQCQKDETSVSERAIGIYDTAIKENVAHAEAFMIVRFSKTKPFKSIQADLMQEYQPRVTPY
jgi:hypothetical protein